MTKIVHPKGWKRPSGYSSAIRARGDMIFVAGQIGWDANHKMVGESLVDQTRQALENIVTVLGEARARPEHIVRMTWYVTDIEDYHANAKAIGEVYRSVMGRHYPAMSLFQVSRLVEKTAKVEIETTAVIPS